MVGEPALPRLRRKCRRRSGAWATPRWSAERRTSRLRGTGTPRKREVASYRRDDLRWYASRRSAGPSFRGRSCSCRQGFGREPRRSAGQGSRDAVETKNNDATTRAQNMRRGNETGCVDRSRGGLFDIVKKDGARAMPRAAFAFARGRSHISGSGALRHRRPSASDGQAAGGLERNRLDAITVSLQVSSGRMVSLRACKFSRSCSGRDDGDGQRGER